MRSFVIAVLPLLVACSNPTPEVPSPPASELEFLHARISSFTDTPGDTATISLNPSARYYTIHPELSPDADALRSFARDAHAAGRRVHATVWIRDRSTKAPPVPDAGRTQHPFVVMRLADTPDPRAPQRQK